MHSFLDKIAGIATKAHRVKFLHKQAHRKFKHFFVLTGAFCLSPQSSQKMPNEANAAFYSEGLRLRERNMFPGWNKSSIRRPVITRP